MFVLNKDQVKLFTQLNAEEKAAIIFILKKFAILRVSKQRPARVLKRRKKEWAILRPRPKGQNRKERTKRLCRQIYIFVQEPELSGFCGLLK